MLSVVAGVQSVVVAFPCCFHPAGDCLCYYYNTKDFSSRREARSDEILKTIYYWVEITTAPLATIVATLAGSQLVVFSIYSVNFVGPETETSLSLACDRLAEHACLAVFFWSLWSLLCVSSSCGLFFFVVEYADHRAVAPSEVLLYKARRTNEH